VNFRDITLAGFTPFANVKQILDAERPGMFPWLGLAGPFIRVTMSLAFFVVGETSGGAPETGKFV